MSQHLVDSAGTYLRNVIADSNESAPPSRWIPLTTKLHIPRPRHDVVARPRLLARLDDGLAGTLTLVSAPAGFGKTTLISNWLTHADLPAAWLSLDAGDNDPSVFLRYLVAALQTVAPDVSTSLHSATMPAEASLHLLLNALAGHPQRCVLVLDDYQVIETAAVHQAMTFFLDHVPGQVHVVITTRSDPPLRLARLRARAHLSELRADDLRFTVDEASEFLTQVMRLPLSADEVAALEVRTEGWIAGLQFAALALRDRTETAEFVRSFTGSHRFVVEYLAEEVLAPQPAHVQAFLLNTSILNRLSAPLCDAVVYGNEADWSQPTHPSSQDILDVLERDNLFIIPLDTERRWYRYHHLFAEVLRARLMRVAPAEDVATLHRRAAGWYEQNGAIAEAIHHSLAAHDWEHTATLIDTHDATLTVSGQHYTTLGWLEQMPAAVVQAHPRLCVLAALALSNTNRPAEAEQWLRHAEHAAQSQVSSDDMGPVLGRVALIRALHCRLAGDLAGCLAFSEQALVALPETDVEPRVGALLNLARGYLETGSATSDSEQLAAEMVAQSRSVGNLFNHVNAITNLAGLHMLQGRLHTADATFARAVQAIPELGELRGLGGTTASYHFGRAALLYEWNRLDEAEQHLVQGMELVAGPFTVDAYVMASGYLTLALLQQACSDTAAAYATLQECTALADDRDFAPPIRARIAAAQARLALMQGDVAGAARWADTCGLHVSDSPEDRGYAYESAYLTLVQIHIAKAKAVEDVFGLLDGRLRCAEADGRVAGVIQIQALRALALQSAGDDAGALASLQQAFLVAEPEGFTRTFLDAGAPMAALLRRAATHGIAPDYVLRLRNAFDGAKTRLHVLHGSPPPPLVEPLSRRELEVLQFIADGLSNPEIAQTLTIAVSTVKTHVNNIFAKLGAESRTQAVARARQFHLL